MARRSTAERALVYVEIEQNWRWGDGEPVCCYLTVIEQRNTLHRRISHTEHIVGQGERLFDDVQRRMRELEREYILTMMQPF